MQLAKQLQLPKYRISESILSSVKQLNCSTYKYIPSNYLCSYQVRMTFQLWLMQYHVTKVFFTIQVMLLLGALPNKTRVQKLVIFYTEILMRKVVLWSFFMSETSEKVHNSTFQVKISVQNVIFSNEMEKYPRYNTHFSIEFGKKYLLALHKNSGFS